MKIAIRLIAVVYIIGGMFFLWNSSSFWKTIVDMFPPEIYIREIGKHVIWIVLCFVIGCGLWFYKKWARTLMIIFNLVYSIYYSVGIISVAKHASNLHNATMSFLYSVVPLIVLTALALLPNFGKYFNKVNRAD